MKDILFLNPIYNGGILFCEENIIFGFALVSLLAGIMTCYKGVESFRSCFSILLFCQFGFWTIHFLPRIFVDADRAQFWELILCFTLYFTLLWLLMKLSRWITSGVAKLFHRNKTRFAAHVRIIIMTLFGVYIVLYCGNRIRFLNTASDFLVGTFLFISGIAYQNWRLNQRPIFYPTYPDLLRMKRREFYEKEEKA